MFRLNLDTKTGSKGSLGGGITGGIALGVVSQIDYLKCSLCRNVGSYIVPIWLEFVGKVCILLSISHVVCIFLWIL